MSLAETAKSGETMRAPWRVSAHHGNPAPQEKGFVVFTGIYFNRVPAARALQRGSDRGDPVWSDSPGLGRTHLPKSKLESGSGVFPVRPRTEEHGRCREKAEKKPGPTRGALRRVMNPLFREQIFSRSPRSPPEITVTLSLPPASFAAATSSWTAFSGSPA